MIHSFIEHTLLAPDATQADIERLCVEAIKFEFKAVCVNPIHVAQAASLLRNQNPFVVSVAGFPTGASFTSSKVLEATAAVEHGASEVDMVLRVGALKDGDSDAVATDIEAVVKAVSGFRVKVIIESGLLDDADICLACSLVEAAGAAFAKTSTGFFGQGATPRVVALMRKSMSGNMGIKASGGIKTREQVDNLIAAGASRIGCSSSLSIIR